MPLASAIKFYNIVCNVSILVSTVLPRVSCLETGHAMLIVVPNITLYEIGDDFKKQR